MNKGTSEQGDQNYIKNWMTGLVKMLIFNSNRVFVGKKERHSGIVPFGFKLSGAVPAGFSD